MAALPGSSITLPTVWYNYRTFLSDEPLLLYGNHMKLARFYFDAFALCEEPRPNKTCQHLNTSCTKW
jgi:hypothetical protein